MKNRKLLYLGFLFFSGNSTQGFLSQMCSFFEKRNSGALDVWKKRIIFFREQRKLVINNKKNITRIKKNTPVLRSVTNVERHDRHRKNFGNLLIEEPKGRLYYKLIYKYIKK